MPVKLPIHRPKMTAAELRQKLSEEVLAGHSGVVDKLCTQANNHVLHAALFLPASLEQELKPKVTTDAQRTALFEVGAAEGGVRQRLHDAHLDRRPLEREQKKTLDSALAQWLTPPESADQATYERCYKKLAQYREYNPNGSIHKRSFVEMLAEAERDGKPYRNVLKTLATEWGDEKGAFTVRRLAKFLLQDMEHMDIPVDRAMRWLKKPGSEPNMRDNMTELVCYKLGLNTAGEAMLWRLTRGNADKTIDEAATRADLFKNLREKSGIPAVRLLPMIDIGVDAASQIERGIDGRALTMPKAVELLEFVQPSKHWLTGSMDKTKSARNWRIARKLGPTEQAQSFDDILSHATASDSPHGYLMSAIVGKGGINPQSIEALQPLWLKANPNGAYSLPNVEDLKAQRSRALTLNEAAVIVGLTRQIYPQMNAAQEETCLEILTRCPPPEELIDRYITQTDSAGNPAKVSLKETLERIALREGKWLEADIQENRFITDVSNVVYDGLRKTDRLSNRTVPLFADRLGLEGERRRKFLLKAQGVALVDPMDIIDDTLGGKILHKEGMKALVEQTGMTATDFGKQHGYERQQMMHWCNNGFTTNTDFSGYLAQDLGRPEMAELIGKTFCRPRQKDTANLDEAQQERTDFHRSRVVQAMLDVPRSR